jgi:positive regulator of sigma E activity
MEKRKAEMEKVRKMLNKEVFTWVRKQIFQHTLQAVIMAVVVLLIGYLLVARFVFGLVG